MANNICGYLLGQPSRWEVSIGHFDQVPVEQQWLCLAVTLGFWPRAWHAGLACWLNLEVFLASHIATTPWVLCFALRNMRPAILKRARLVFGLLRVRHSPVRLHEPRGS